MRVNFHDSIGVGNHEIMSGIKIPLLFNTVLCVLVGKIQREVCLWSHCLINNFYALPSPTRSVVTSDETHPPISVLWHHTVITPVSRWWRPVFRRTQHYSSFSTLSIPVASFGVFSTPPLQCFLLCHCGT